MLGPDDAARDARIAAVAAALETHNIDVVVVETAAEARSAVLALIPDGGEIHWGKSKTIEDLGISAYLLESPSHDALRPRYMKMDRATQGREIRKLMAAPDVMLGSVAAVTEGGALVAASARAASWAPTLLAPAGSSWLSEARRWSRISTLRCGASTTSYFPGRTTRCASGSASPPGSRRS